MTKTQQYAIMRSGTNPPEYFCTKKKCKKIQNGEMTTIHRISGGWSLSLRNARKWPHKDYKLPAGCEFVEIPPKQNHRQVDYYAPRLLRPGPL